MPETAIGKVTHYFDRINVAALSLSAPLKVGDRIRFKGHTTDCTMTVDHMQIEHKDVQEAKPGDDVAVHVAERVRAHDEVFQVQD